MTASPAGCPRPEIELLLRCARTRIDDEQASIVRGLVRGGLDWDWLIATASREEILPLLYWALNATCPGDVPEDALARLRNLFHANAGHNLALTRELTTILGLCQAEGVAAIPLKGPALAVAAYGNLALRQFGDLDILVRARDVPRCDSLLTSRGYRPVTSPLTADEVINLRGSGFHPPYHATYLAPDSATSVEVHWDIAPRAFSRPIDVDAFWTRLGSLHLGGRVVPAFSPADLVLILSVHGAKHGWGELKWIADFAELIGRHADLDWGAILAGARSIGKQRVLLLALRVAHEFLGAPLPDPAARRIRADPMVLGLARQVGDRLLRDDPPTLPEPCSLIALSERRRDRLRHRLRRLRAALTPRDADRELAPYPPLLPFVPYLVRPMRIVGSRFRRGSRHRRPECAP